MAKSKSERSLWGELISLGLYKRNQGRLVRQLTAAGASLIVIFGTWTLSQGPLSGYDSAAMRVGLPVLITAIGMWVIFRIVNYPEFANFLISVEAEMAKVSWSDRSRLLRATAVTIVVMFTLGALLFFFDLFWIWFFKLVGFLQDVDVKDLKK